MEAKHIKYITIISIILIYGFFTYLPSYGYWIAPVSSVAIVVLAYKGLGGHWRAVVGLDFRVSAVFLALVLFCFISILSFLLIDYMAGFGNIISNYYFSFLAVHSLAQTFNEEIILGALIVLSLKRKFEGTHGVSISLSVSFLFSLLHLLFYAYLIKDSQGLLFPLTVINLGLVGFVRNYFIFNSGHILYAWSLHFGFNSQFFSFNIMNGVVKMPEYELFNVFIGSWYVFIFTLLLSAVLIFKYRNINKYPS